MGQIFIENSLTTKKIFISGTGEEKLDFTYIDDFVNGVKLCCENDQAKNQTFNITFGEAKAFLLLLILLKRNFLMSIFTTRKRQTNARAWNIRYF